LTLIGHESARSALRSGLLSRRSMPAWIFGGPAGVGKRTAAEQVAALIVDPETTATDIAAFIPPTNSRSGVLSQAGTHPDIHVVTKELALQSPIREVRDRKLRTIPVAVLRQQVIGGAVDGHVFEAPAYMKPYHGHAKVFIIDEAELLGTEAQNLLLKTLEEPPPNTFFILVTTRPDTLLPTILSRCQSVRFGVLSESEMAEWCERQNFEAAAEALDFAMQFAAGAPGHVIAALEEDLHGWHRKIDPMLEDLLSGGYPATMASDIAKLIDESATAAEKAKAQTSKEAAGQRATRLMVSLLGTGLRVRLRESLQDPDRAERIASGIEALVDSERRIAANVNRKLALSGLVSSLAQTLSPRGTSA
jgi:DNA polymerase-3 subunit delta'